jgi:GTP pyrophosphokinase
MAKARTATETIEPSQWLAEAAKDWQPEWREQVARALDILCRNGVPDDLLQQTLAIASTLAEFGLEPEVLCAVLLQTAVAAGCADLDELGAEFEQDTLRVLDEVRRLDDVGELRLQGTENLGGEQLEGLRKLLLAVVKDVRVVLVKLVRRLHEMRSLKQQLPDEQLRIARETMDVYAPLANRLGIGQVKWELEDLALRFLERDTYKHIARLLDERRTDRERYIQVVVRRLQDELQEAGIEASVVGRPKHIYSIWRKMQRKQLAFDQLFDVRAVRVLTGSVRDCYAALGVVHGLWPHLPKEFDDYIANPKSNGYQSLHTAVLGPRGKTVEVQIRTWDMHRSAELGVAAHWRYKEATKGGEGLFEQRIRWLRQMLESRDDDNEDLLDRFQSEAMEDRVYVLTPDGDVVEMAPGCTPLDFAYRIHTNVGHSCRGAKIDGRIVSLNYALQTGDQVEVLTSKSGVPSRDWLNPNLGYLRSSRARHKVRQWFRQADQSKNIAAGRSAVERELNRLGIRGANLLVVAQSLNYQNAEDMWAAVGFGDLTTTQVATAAQQQMPREDTDREFLPVSKPQHRPGAGEAGITIEGVGNLLTVMGKCCKPVPQDAIVGFITQGRGVTIHRKDCPNLLNMAGHHPERIIEVNWGGPDEGVYPVDIHLEAYDRTGLLRDITSVLANEKVNVLAVNTRSDPESFTADMTMTLELADLAKLSRVLDRLMQLPNVIDVRRRTAS